MIPTNPYRKNTHGSSPVFIVKRPTLGGEIKSVITRRFGVDPLETLDGVHIPIGEIEGSMLYSCVIKKSYYFEFEK